MQRNARSPLAAGSGPQEFLKNRNLSQYAWLDQLLQRMSVAHKLALLLAQAESSWSVSTVLIVSAGLGGDELRDCAVLDSGPAACAGCGRGSDAHPADGVAPASATAG